ncbi:MAG: b(o/a)3-type cytochrome-c oxidase subunit 1 [Haloarculaceae archaeon]|jgi:cytochrome c oxidase subunit 1
MSTQTGEPSFLDRYPEEASIVKRTFFIAFVALGIGALLGMLQALHRTNVLRILPSDQYYTMLTLHAVLLALVFSIMFLLGLFLWAMTRSFDRGVVDIRFTKTWLGVMALGTTLAGIAMIGGFFSEIPLSADVLYTFYAPLQAHPAYYAGLAIFIIGSWLAGVDFLRTYRAWRKENPDERIPLQSFMVLMTMLMWYIATIGVAIAVVVFLLPWSLGLFDQVNVLLTRTLFWFFGHPVVYFWLMPAYLLWYTVMPKIAGGRLFSDPLARVVFVLFLVLSVPTGIHHQYVDPGISEGFKFIAMTNTMFLLLPSLLTAFTVVASIEHGARQRGGTGYFGWLKALPWRDPAFTGMALAGVMFAAAGFSGMINAGMSINYLVHNTLWVPGHFHLTVGTAVALTFMAATYWLWPQLTNRDLFSRPIALAQVVLWFGGMVLMSNAMHIGGLSSIPRRTAEPQYAQFEFEPVFGVIGVSEIRIQIAVGGTLLFISAVLFLGNIAISWGQPKRSGFGQTLPPALSGAADSPRVLDNLALWTVIALVLVVLAYALPIGAIIADGGLFGPGGSAYPALLDPAVLDAATASVAETLDAVSEVLL